jgi:hypothetical protein
LQAAGGAGSRGIFLSFFLSLGREKKRKEAKKKRERTLAGELQRSERERERTWREASEVCG